MDLRTQGQLVEILLSAWLSLTLYLLLLLLQVGRQGLIWVGITFAGSLALFRALDGTLSWIKETNLTSSQGSKPDTTTKFRRVTWNILNSDGDSDYSVTHEIVNHSDEPIRSMHHGIVLARGRMPPQDKLEIVDDQNNPLHYENLDMEETGCQFDVIFREPLQPGESYRYTYTLSGIEKAHAPKDTKVDTYWWIWRPLSPVDEFQYEIHHQEGVEILSKDLLDMKDGTTLGQHELLRDGFRILVDNLDSGFYQVLWTVAR